MGLLVVLPLMALACFLLLRIIGVTLVPQYFIQFLSQFVIWRVVCGGDLDPHKPTIFSAPLITRYVVSCGKNCLEYHGTSVAQITALSNPWVLAWCRFSLIAASVAFIWWRPKSIVIV